MVTSPSGHRCCLAEISITEGPGQKNLALVEDSWISLRPGTTKRFLSPECKAPQGVYQERWFLRYMAPRSLKVS